MSPAFKIKPKSEKLRIIGCPEGCRKKFEDENGINNHLTKKHKIKTYKIKIQKGHAYRVMTINNLVPEITA